MLVNALIVGFVVAFAKFFDWWFSSMLSRPIFVVALLGVLLGHPKEGIILGAQLELIFLGNVSLGGVMPTDFTLGSIFGAAFAMTLGSNLNTAIALAVPISMLGTLLYTVMKMVITALVPRFEKLIKEKNIKGFNRLWFFQMCGYELAYFLLGFIVIIAGSGAIKALVANIPAWVQSSMTVASTMLPAIGLALLLKMLWNKSLAPYYFLGFGMGAFFLYDKATTGTIAKHAVTLAYTSTKSLTLVQIAFFGFIIAALVTMSELHKQKKLDDQQSNQNHSSKDDDDESEDFFND
ncbi:PTS mannose/fructose/sorbose/N-acetylgalactosamine transporter subunit IIC [Lacticaseibacillus jixiensis]|uniref:PTS mannose/fructose/sorbose/N-acetylgalactosamine transporter subunit IIC n=1 Tax=Lacticaseibacillus jixiensis TaxID=3231926 RepID=UPI0036F2A592